MNSSQKTEQSDSVIKVESHHVVIGQLARFIEQHNVRANRVAKLELDTLTGKIVLGLVTGDVDVRTKVSLAVAYATPNFIGTLIRAGSFHFFEGTSSITSFTGLDRLVASLGGIKDAKTGAPVQDLYTPIPAVGRLTQFVMHPDRETIRVMNPTGHRGLASVRCLPGTGQLLAVRQNESGTGVSIDTLPLAQAEKDPTNVGNLNLWTPILKADGRSILSLARPKVSKQDGRIHVVVNFESGFERMLTLENVHGIVTGTWGVEHRTNDVAIGIVNGSDDLFARYTPQPHSASIEFNAPSAQDKIASAYMA